MNIFYLHTDVTTCAQQHCDQHVIKMVIEYAQMLSTCHRILDGTMTPFTVNVDGKVKSKKILLLPGESINIQYEREDVLNQNGAVVGWKEVPKVEIINKQMYKASHANHPCNVWARDNVSNYNYLYNLLVELLKEFTFRRNKHHSVEALLEVLKTPPKNIKQGEFYDPPKAMPDQFKVDDVTLSYQNFYVLDKIRFAKWSYGRQAPEWFIKRTTNETNVTGEN
jgi:hypothetical protein